MGRTKDNETKKRKRKTRKRWNSLGLPEKKKGIGKNWRATLQGKGGLLHTEWTDKWLCSGTSTCVRARCSNPGLCGRGVIQDVFYFWVNACAKCVIFAGSFVCGKCVVCPLINVGPINAGALLLTLLIEGRALPCGWEHRWYAFKGHRCAGHPYVRKY